MATSLINISGVTTPEDHKRKMDILEGMNARLPQVICPLVHRFTDHLYVREIHMPAGALVTSRVHKTRHPFVLTKGVVDVMSENGARETLVAPFTGITEAGTRRALYIVEDAVWTTFHVTAKKDPIEIEDEITYTDNDLLPQGFRQGYLGSPIDVTIDGGIPCLA